jgi:hypothetical protein
LGTFHSKFAVIDRQVALVNSNNINIRSNVEMMCQFEGDVVNSLYDAFLISWGKEIPNPPGLPCVTIPAASNREFYFGQRQPCVENKSTGQEQADSAHEGGDGTSKVTEQLQSTNISDEEDSSKKGKKAAQEAKDAELRHEMENDEYTHLAEHASDPMHAIISESKRYNKENHIKTAQPINERLNSEETAEQTEFEFDTEFAPFYLHSPHKPVPMALVNRQPQAMPGHHDLHNPQNAAWLQGLSLLGGGGLTCSVETCEKGRFYSVSGV